MHKVLVLLAVLMLAACRPSSEEPAALTPIEPPAAAVADEAEAAPPPAEEAIEHSGFESDVEPHTARLARVLAAQAPEIQARYDARHPQQTLEFFGITPGMTVVEALPGGGWYSRILMPYLGEQGTLVGANYPVELFRQFDFATEEFMAGLAGWLETFPQEAAEWCSEDCAAVRGFFFGDLAAESQGTADAVLFIRALHNMARFQNQGVDDFLDQAFADAFAVLKPGGVLGIVQHEAPADADEAWATGGAGYLKRDFLIAQAEAAGFELEAASDINANEADQPTSSDVVWRLAPALGTTEEGTPEREAMAAIGESNRMTLKFRKPALVADQ